MRKRLERGVIQPSPTESIMLLPLDERKEVLKEIALHAIEKPVTAGQKIAAIKEINLMEHVYDVPFGGNQDNRTINIFVADEDTKREVQRLMLGGKPKEVIEGEAKIND